MSAGSSGTVATSSEGPSGASSHDAPAGSVDSRRCISALCRLGATAIAASRATERNPSSTVIIPALNPGAQWGMHISYAVQPEPGGLAQAFTIGAPFIGEDKVSLVLGDNIFHGTGLGSRLTDCMDVDGAHIFGYHVAQPSSYGVVEFDDG